MYNECYQGLSGRIVTLCDASYHSDRQDWNRAVQQFPLIINYCRTAQDVSHAVLWARRNGVPLRVRNGGHNYEGYSNGNCVLVIDVSEMNGIELDEQRQTVRIQGGVTNRQLYDYVSSRGYPFPGGTCPTVGVCGYALGGGWGLSCRYFGLGCDSIEEVELIGDERQLIRANRLYNPDLFWALRGAGGGNFGVVVSMTLQLPPRIEYVTLIEIDYYGANVGTQAQFLQTWQDWIGSADPRLTLLARIYHSEADGLSMLVRGIFYGEAAEAAQFVQAFLAIPGAVSDIRYMTFLEAVTILGAAYPEFERFQSVSRFVYRYFTPEELQNIVGLIQQRAPGSVYAGLSMYALGGQVAAVGVDDTAFFHRNAHYILWLETIWEDDRFAADNSEWINRQLQSLIPLTTGSYVNFPYSQLYWYQSEYYGYHLAALKAIKQKYDPCDIFTFPQGLGQCECCRAEQPPFTAEQSPLCAEESPAQMSAMRTNYRGFRYVEPPPEPL